jgi:hypothetical protein
MVNSQWFFWTLLLMTGAMAIWLAKRSRGGDTSSLSAMAVDVGKSLGLTPPPAIQKKGTTAHRAPLFGAYSVKHGPPRVVRIVRQERNHFVVQSGREFFRRSIMGHEWYKFT